GGVGTSPMLIDLQRPLKMPSLGSVVATLISQQRQRLPGRCLVVGGTHRSQLPNGLLQRGRGLGDTPLPVLGPSDGGTRPRRHPTIRFGEVEEAPVRVSQRLQAL